MNPELFLHLVGTLFLIAVMSVLQAILVSRLQGGLIDQFVDSLKQNKVVKK